MSYLSALGAWFLTTLLEWLYGKAIREVGQIANQIKTERERGQVNEETVKKYHAAIDRTKRREAALSLLNGTRAP